MDITLLLLLNLLTAITIRSFNPCFNGYYTSTNLVKDLVNEINSCFNPCFNGYYTSTIFIRG